jgi:Mg-chelatase subunit ChlD
MSSQWSQALSGINTYVAELLRQNIEARIKVVAFDIPISTSNCELVTVRDCNITDYTNILYTEISPRGGTPLFEAVARVISEAEEANHERTSLIIMTDGMDSGYVFENTRDSVKASVERVENKGWEVTFLGANFDVVTYNNQSLNISAGSTMNFTPQNVEFTMTSSALRSAGYARTGVLRSYTDEERTRASGDDQ